MTIINKINNLIWWILVIMFSIITINAHIQNHSTDFTFKCFKNRSNKGLPQFTNKLNDKLEIETTNNVLNQIISRIYSIYLIEILNYEHILLTELNFSGNTSEERKLNDIVNRLEDQLKPKLNLAVWKPSKYHGLPLNFEAGNTGPMGRYGWFFPRSLYKNRSLLPLYPYTMFSNNSSEYVRNIFSFDKSILDMISKYIEKESNSEQCTNNTDCAILLAPSYKETGFAQNIIDNEKLYIKIIWLGENLKYIIEYLEIYYRQQYGMEKNFLFICRTPSDIVTKYPGNYEMISLPKCEQISKTSLCLYEYTPMIKFYSNKVKDDVLNSLWGFWISDEHLLLDRYNNERNKRIIIDNNDLNRNNFNEITKIPQFDEFILQRTFNQNNTIDIYNEIACNWIKKNEDNYRKWTLDNPKLPDIIIGGIFPITTNGTIYSGLTTAAEMAINSINDNKTLLTKLNLKLLAFDGQCRQDSVMQAFINIFMTDARVLGVLGPACSETVEPIAGISKHFRMPIISYSAEGYSFTDRNTYPYFFRTIGENRQYEPVYIQLLKHMDWQRVAAITEDGQKYTEYITHMETPLKENGIEIISNKKFPRNVLPSEMNTKLNEFKEKNVRIIIADIYDDVAQLVLCEAHKLKMSAKDGYVWFLPYWLNKQIFTVTNNDTKSIHDCTMENLKDMINGHFSLSHAPYAPDESIMQENKTIKQWKNEYNEMLPPKMENSIYAGYAFDAVWVYAYALDKLLQENTSHLIDLHSKNTTKRLVELIESTDFNGVSGRIQFGDGASRFSIINVHQYYENVNYLVGTFTPNISIVKNSRLRKLIGGKLVLNSTKIVWMGNGKPSDGRQICAVDGLAKFLNVDCTVTVYILTAVICLFVVLLVSIASFVFWKRQYDQKLKQSAKLMRNFGINLYEPNAMTSNTLDKWEVPKDRVVINRKLGEGAFGTVYGGEAQLYIDGDTAGCWTAIAVKTLKIGSTTEDRLDFLSEAEAMKRFDHKNIVKLLGVCLQTEPIYTIMEFMLYGDLKTFLLARRHLVGEKITDESDISPKRLTIMALDVSRALSYLTDNKYVHRDIACRNCLVNVNRMVKLGDFGMARPMYENDYYKFNRKGMLPVRWMAPESLGLGIFTPSSDVWSFGVLLYEIITFGSFPFQGLTNNQVLQYIKAGNTLEIPSGIKPHLEGLMKACWNTQYKKRPSAAEITEFISNYPRLVTPCLDVPISSVQMPETESDQLELLPSLRKRNNILGGGSRKSELTSSSTLNNLDENPSTLPNGIILSDLNVMPDFDGIHFNGDNNVLLPQYNGAATNNTTTTFSNHFGVDSDNNNYYTPNGGLLSTKNSSNSSTPIDPLLPQQQQEITKSNLSLRRYVPMYGFKKSNRSLTIDTSAL